MTQSGSRAFRSRRKGVSLRVTALTTLRTVRLGWRLGSQKTARASVLSIQTERQGGGDPGEDVVLITERLGGNQG